MSMFFYQDMSKYLPEGKSQLDYYWDPYSQDPRELAKAILSIVVQIIWIGSSTMTPHPEIC